MPLLRRTCERVEILYSTGRTTTLRGHMLACFESIEVEDGKSLTGGSKRWLGDSSNVHFYLWKDAAMQSML